MLAFVACQQFGRTGPYEQGNPLRGKLNALIIEAFRVLPSEKILKYPFFRTLIVYNTEFPGDYKWT
jgi:hypothetical protein